VANEDGAVSTVALCIRDIGNCVTRLEQILNPPKSFDQCTAKDIRGILVEVGDDLDDMEKGCDPDSDMVRESRSAIRKPLGRVIQWVEAVSDRLDGEGLYNGGWMPGGPQ
jgi:hypothetical protein